MRVPTYATYLSMLDGVLANKAVFDKYNYQAMSGLKSATYAGYGMQSFNIVSLEASLNLVNTFLDNNNLANTQITAMNAAIESISTTANDFKSMLSNFASAASGLTPDYTGGQISFTDNNAAYLGTTITFNGTQYIFASAPGAPGTVPVDVDISGLAPGSATYAQDVLAALVSQVNATDPGNQITQSGDTITFPLYTVNGGSSVLGVAGVTTGAPVTMTQDQYLTLQQLQSLAFASMLILADTLNLNANGQYYFGGGAASGSPVSFPFSNIGAFQSYYDGINISYPATAGADLSNRRAEFRDTGALTIQSTGENTGSITAANAGGFLKDALTANAQTTGDLTFDAAANSVRAQQYGAFNTLKVGDSLVLGGTGIDPSNAQAYRIKSISSDGRTIEFEPDTPVGMSETVTPANDVTFSTSFPIGSVVNLEGFGSNIAGQIQVTGISADGSTLYFKADPALIPSAPATISNPGYKMYAHSYYQGGDLNSEQRISESQTISFDIKASDPAFEKMMRAFGIVAQASVVDTRNPASITDGTLINPDLAAERLNEALDLISEALFNPNEHAVNSRNYDLYTVAAKISANSQVLNAVIDNQNLVSVNLTNDINSIMTVDQTEAAAKALLASTNLQASYAILQNALNISLLNYL